MITLDQAYEMGAKGAEPTEAESLLFEAWMRGHCWMVHGDWDGKTYVHATERNGEVNYHTMHTRQLWAAWRDRAALAKRPAQQEPAEWMELLREARDNCKASIVEEGISASRKEYRIDLEARLTAALNTSPQPAQRKPVAWMEMVVANLVREGVNKHKARELAQHFYTSPSQRTWVGLTDEEDAELWKRVSHLPYNIVRHAIEVKLKEKNT